MADKQLFFSTAPHPIDLDDGRTIEPLGFFEVEEQGPNFEHYQTLGWITEAQQEPAKSRRSQKED